MKKETEVSEILVPKIESNIELPELQFGQVLVEIISGDDKGKIFITSVETANLYFNNEEIFQQKKN